MDKKKKNILIGGLLAVVLLLAVGYAAFATNLTINGTSNIDSRWDVHIKDGGVTVKSATMATSRSAQKDSQLTASFICELTDPGVSTISYDIIVENTGTFGAKLSSINLTGTTDYVDAETEGIEVGDVIAADGGTDTLTVTVSYKNVSTVPTGDDATANITVTLNYIQDDGAGGGDEQSDSDVPYDSTTGNGTIYRWSTTAWYSSGTTASGKTVTDISSMDEGTDYVTDPSDLNKNYYLKHKVENNIVTENYVCFVYSNVERCLKGFDTTAFSDNTTLVQAYQTAAGLSTVANPSVESPGCKFDSSGSYCYGGGFHLVTVRSVGRATVYGASASVYCDVGTNGWSACYGQ